MTIRIEPFIQGFIAGIKPQMTYQDREMLTLIFQGQKPYTYSSQDELNPVKPAFYFRFRANHLNVLLPTWLLNGRKSSKADRFRIASTEDHSVIFDTKESIIYDPTTETAHSLPEYRPFWTAGDWKEEAMSLLRDELQAKRLVISSFVERIEQIPSVYEIFQVHIQKNRLKASLKDFRFGLDLSEIRKTQAHYADRDRAIVEAVIAELWSRSSSKSA